MRCRKCNMEIPAGCATCPECGAPVGPTAQNQNPAEIEKTENIPLGILGALGGALLGALSIILLGQLNMIAAISGFILAFCTLKGYEKLGGKLSVVGIIVSILLMLVTPYLADRISWALIIVKELPDFSFTEAFASVPEIIQLSELEGAYFKDILMLYGFCVLGAFSTVASVLKKK